MRLMLTGQLLGRVSGINVLCVQLMLDPSWMTGPNGLKVIGSSLVVNTKEARRAPLGTDSVTVPLDRAGTCLSLHLGDN